MMNIRRSFVLIKSRLNASQRVIGISKRNFMGGGAPDAESHYEVRSEYTPNKQESDKANEIIDTLKLYKEKSYKFYDEDIKGGFDTFTSHISTTPNFYRVLGEMKACNEFTGILSFYLASEEQIASPETVASILLCMNHLCVPIVEENKIIYQKNVLRFHKTPIVEAVTHLLNNDRYNHHLELVLNGTKLLSSLSTVRSTVFRKEATIDVIYTLLEKYHKNMELETLLINSLTNLCKLNLSAPRNMHRLGCERVLTRLLKKSVHDFIVNDSGSNSNTSVTNSITINDDAKLDSNKDIDGTTTSENSTNHESNESNIATNSTENALVLVDTPYLSPEEIKINQIKHINSIINCIHAFGRGHDDIAKDLLDSDIVSLYSTILKHVYTILNEDRNNNVFNTNKALYNELIISICYGISNVFTTSMEHQTRAGSNELCEILADVYYLYDIMVAEDMMNNAQKLSKYGGYATTGGVKKNVLQDKQSKASPTKDVSVGSNGSKKDKDVLKMLNDAMRDLALNHEENTQKFKTMDINIVDDGF